EPAYEQTARGAADFILATMAADDGSLLRRYRAGIAGIEGMLDDYAFFAQALLDLYEATFEFRYLERAIAITSKQCELLEDTGSGGFFASAHADTSRLMRLKDDYDGAEPSGNSVALMNLLRLHRVTGKAHYEASARKLLAAFQQRLTEAPYGMPQMLCACEFDLAPPREIVVAGAKKNDMTKLLWNSFDPHRVLLYASAELTPWQPAMAEMKAGEGGTSVYVCENFTCNAPVHTAEELARLLK
ncbi:MAG: thioredoxin domain-containing protein, partial [Terriglobia bacterium]